MEVKNRVVSKLHTIVKEHKTQNILSKRVVLKLRRMNSKTKITISLSAFSSSYHNSFMRWHSHKICLMSQCPIRLKRQCYFRIIRSSLVIMRITMKTNPAVTHRFNKSTTQMITSSARHQKISQENLKTFMVWALGWFGHSVPSTGATWRVSTCTSCQIWVSTQIKNIVALSARSASLEHVTYEMESNCRNQLH